MIKLETTTAYSIEEVAERLNVTPETVRRNIRQGNIKAKKVCRRWYITEQALTDYVTGEAKETR